MAAASLDVKFEEELSAVGNVSTLIPITVHSDGHFPQVFMILSEPERTVALCNLLQHSTQVQTCFFIPVLQQIARADFMTALLSPAIRVFMEIQIEAKLASMNVKSNVLASLPTVSLTPTPRTASLSPLTRALPSSLRIPPIPSTSSSDAAEILAQQCAKLKASREAAHRISAPALASNAGERGSWAGVRSLGQAAAR